MDHRVHVIDGSSVSSVLNLMENVCILLVQAVYTKGKQYLVFTNYESLYFMKEEILTILCLKDVFIYCHIILLQLFKFVVVYKVVKKSDYIIMRRVFP